MKTAILTLLTITVLYLTISSKRFVLAIAHIFNDVRLLNKNMYDVYFIETRTS